VKKIVDIYRCRNKRDAYVYMEKGAKLDTLPHALVRQAGHLELAMTLVMTPERKLAQADAGKVLAAIHEQGFYLQVPPQVEQYMQIRNDKLTSKPI